MTAPGQPVPTASLPSFGLRVAATLSAVVGVLSTAAVIGMEVEMARLPNPPWVAMVSNPAAALFVCAAAVLLWQGRKWGGYLLAAGAILPNVVSLAYGQPLRAPGLLMILAIITVAANWRQLR